MRDTARVQPTTPLVLKQDAVNPPTEFHRALGLFDSVMVVAGIMVGSGIFIVSAEISRQVGSAGWLLVAWVITGVLTFAGALSYGELAAMMPEAGGMYVYLREAFSPLLGFLYGWTMFTVIQTGTIAAVGIAFARFSGVLLPSVREDNYLIAPIQVLPGYAVSLSTAQLLAIVIIVLITVFNCYGVKWGKLIQNVFTVAKLGGMVALLALGAVVAFVHPAVLRANFAAPWHPVNVTAIHGLEATTAFGLFIALCVSQTGSLFAADSWHDITFVAAEVRNPKRNLPLALAIGTSSVIVLYLLCNLCYLAALPIHAIQTAPQDRVATLTVDAALPGLGRIAMAILIMVSTFGTVNALALAGGRACFAMAQDKLFFRRAGVLNQARVPGWALAMQCLWSAFLVLPRTHDRVTGTYGNLYSNLLDYVISAALLFYILTVAGLFRLRRTRPNANRPYRAWGYPWLPGLYIAGAAVILAVLFVYRTTTTWPGLLIIASGLPIYFAVRRRNATGDPSPPPAREPGL
jgi:basic amino acid/polyamine antiporter, APA family